MPLSNYKVMDHRADPHTQMRMIDDNIAALWQRISNVEQSVEGINDSVTSILNSLSSLSSTISSSPIMALSVSAPLYLIGSVITLQHTANLQISAGQLDTIQDIQTTSSPVFAGLTLTGFNGVVNATAGVLSAITAVDGDILIGNATPEWAKLARSVPAANVRNVLGLDNGDLRPAWKTALDATDPVAITIGAAASPGTSLIFSHLDHQHASPATWTPTPHNVLSASHADSVAAACVLGDVIVGLAGPSWTRYALAVPAANVRNIFGVDTGETVPTWKAALDATLPATIAVGGAGTAGTSLLFSHRDHNHPAPATWTASNHNLFSAIHADTTAGSPVVGDIVVGIAGPSWSKLANVPVGEVLVSSGAGTALSWTTAHDTNYSATIGRATIGYDGSTSDFATFAHHDNNSSVNYAFGQNASGDSFINAKTGRQIFFGLNGSGVANVSATGFGMGTTSASASILELYSSTTHPILTITGAHATAYSPQISYRTDASPTQKAVMGVLSTNDALYLEVGSGTVGTNATWGMILGNTGALYLNTSAGIDFRRANVSFMGMTNGGTGSQPQLVVGAASSARGDNIIAHLSQNADTTLCAYNPSAGASARAAIFAAAATYNVGIYQYGSGNSLTILGTAYVECALLYAGAAFILGTGSPNPQIFYTNGTANPRMMIDGNADVVRLLGGEASSPYLYLVADQGDDISDIFAIYNKYNATSADNLLAFANDNAVKGALVDLMYLSTGGDLYFNGAGTGLPYGSCYGNHIAWTQADMVQNTWYNIADTDMTDGSGGLNLMTHDGSGKLTVTKAGRYKIEYTITFSDDTANDHIETGIEISGGGSAVADGQGHLESKFANEEEFCGGTAILSLAAGATIEVCIRTTDASTPDIEVQMLNITAIMVGG